MPRPLHRSARQAALGLACLGLAALAHAHGDEPHDGDAHGSPTPTAESAPRAQAQAQTDAFELVAVLTPAGTGPAQLTLYLDRFDTNAPVTHATVEVESGPLKAVAKAVEPGVYTVPGQAFAEAGRHPLTISVQADDNADLLEATLVTPGDLAASPSSPTGRLFGLPIFNQWVALGGLAVLTWAGVVVWRRVRRSPL